MCMLMRFSVALTAEAPIMMPSSMDFSSLFWYVPLIRTD